MPVPALATDAAAVVVKGAFNPAIFSPSWLLARGLVGETESNDARIELISRELAAFSMDWLTIQVTLDGLQLSTESIDETERLRDVAIGILKSLPHTPLAAMGLNRMVHYEAPDQATLHVIGDRLIPKQDWEGIVRFPATKSVAVIGIRPDDDRFGGTVSIQVEPSTALPLGVYVAINDHFDLKIRDAPAVSRNDVHLPTPMPPRAEALGVAVEILVDQWNRSRARSDKILSRLGGLK